VSPKAQQEQSSRLEALNQAMVNSPNAGNFSMRHGDSTGFHWFLSRIPLVTWYEFYGLGPQFEGFEKPHKTTALGAIFDHLRGSPKQGGWPNPIFHRI